MQYIKNISIRSIIMMLICMLAISPALYAQEKQGHLYYYVYINDEYVGIVEDDKIIEDYIDKQYNKLLNKYKEAKGEDFDILNVVEPNVKTVSFYSPTKIEVNSKEVNEKIVYEFDLNISAKELSFEDGTVLHVSDVRDYDAMIPTFEKVVLGNQELYTLFQKNIAFTYNGSYYSNYQVQASDYDKEDGFTTSEKLLMTKKEILSYMLYKNKLQIDTLEKEAKRKINVEHLTPEDIKLLRGEGTLFSLSPAVTLSYDKQVTEKKDVAFKKERKETDALKEGETKISQKGVNGVAEQVYNVRFTNGFEDKRDVVKETVIKQPVNEITEVGTFVATQGKTSYGTSKVEGSAYTGNVDSLGSGTFLRPSTGTLSCGFGCYAGHVGVDFTGYGTPISAADGGTVVYAISGFKPGNYGDGGGYGNHVIIDHGNGYTTLYAHMSSLAVSVGDVVTRGQVIGAQGCTGYTKGRYYGPGCYGAHLHFEIKLNGTNLNPSSFIGG